MKKFAVVLALGMIPAGMAMADKNIGCGLGTQIFEGQEGLFPKVLGATTNGSFGNQTFGISSGTLGCSSDGVVKAELRTQHFAGANIDQLASEVAAGEGESLNTLASLYDVAPADRAHFNQVAQAHYVELFAKGDTGSMLAALDHAMAADARLARYV